MRILVISDTHGRTEKAIEVYKILKQIDLVVHLGDFYSDAKTMEKQLGIPVLSVKGNMDGSFSSNEYKILETEFGNIYIAHGHIESVKSNPQKLMYKAESLGCKAAFYGHTHVPIFEEVNGMYLLNPGSLTLPAGGRQGSYAIANISPKSIDASIIYLTNTAPPNNTYSNPGFIKNMLNNSDRF